MLVPSLVKVVWPYSSLIMLYLFARKRWPKRHLLTQTHTVPARCRVKVVILILVLRKHRVVQHMYDVCITRIRQNSMHGSPKLLTVK